MFLVVLIVMVGVSLGVGSIWVVRRGRERPAALQGDWWERFEREFRAYAARCDARAREPRQKPH